MHAARDDIENRGVIGHLQIDRFEHICVVDVYRNNHRAASRAGEIAGNIDERVQDFINSAIYRADLKSMSILERQTADIEVKPLPSHIDQPQQSSTRGHLSQTVGLT